MSVDNRITILERVQCFLLEWCNMERTHKNNHLEHVQEEHHLVNL